jgi:hypothetical protein
MLDDCSPEQKEHAMDTAAAHFRPHNFARILTGVVVAGWFMLALALSLAGVFDSRRQPPIALGLAAILPVLIFAVTYLGFPRFRQHVLAADLRLLTLAQAWRIGGIVFVALYLLGMLPGIFALPAGLGDMTVGATAPVIAWMIHSKPRFPRRAFLRWTAFGMLDLVTAVTLGVLSSPSPIGILAGHTTTQVMGVFPMSLIPTFFVPLLFILHLIGLGISRRIES